MSELLPNHEVNPELQDFSSRIVFLITPSNQENQIDESYFSKSPLIPRKITNSILLEDLASEFLVRTEVFKLPEKNELKSLLKDLSPQLQNFPEQDLNNLEITFQGSTLNQYFSVLKEVVTDYSGNTAEAILSRLKNFLNIIVFDSLNQTTSLSETA